MTSRADGRLTRTIVNRLWARLMGRGLVEPVDEMDNRPWNPDLLDWLAADFADNGYDVKKLIEQIVTSRAYQLPVGRAEVRAGDRLRLRRPGGEADDGGAVRGCGRLADGRLAEAGQPVPDPGRAADLSRPAAARP